MTGWPPKDWRAFTALVFSVLGAVVLTAFVWWGFANLLPAEGWGARSELHRAQTLRWVLWISAGSIGAVLLGLGMAINRRSFKGNLGGSGFEFEGGEGPVEAARQTAAAAADKAEEIAAAVDDPPGGA